MERNIYLSNTDIEDAVNAYLEKMMPVADLVKTEKIPAAASCGRVTARPIFARLSSPNHNAAAMDGIMVISEKTFGAKETGPVVLNREEDFEYINTGHLIKEPYDSVIMIEDITELNDDQVRIMAAASPWQHIRPIGEDIVAGEMILPENHRIRPMDIGAVLASGITEILVYEKVRVGIMPTGNEITDEYSNLEKGKSFDTNSWTFKAMVEEWGGEAERISPVPDEYEKLKEEALALLERNHVLIINAGSSAGSKDFTASLISDLGELLLHGIAIKPGKPTILGFVSGKPVIGVPGYPGSAYLVFEEVAGPVIRRLQRVSESNPVFADAVVSRRIISSLKYREYLRVKLGKVGDKLIATPLNRGAGVTMTLVKSDGVMVIPKNSEGLEAGEGVKVQLTRDLSAIENTIVSIGSHDLIMDFIGSFLEKYSAKAGRPAMHLSSAHVGSMGGILALKRGEAHLAPIHLLDEETGEYNRSYINKYFNGASGEIGKVRLVKGVKREQGFMTAPGNPLNIKTVEDLARKDILFVNRQKGSGTRILTDHLLKKAGISFDSIKGYAREMTTHMSVAAAVESGTANVGVGVYSAAKSMGLDFVPIGYEEYDFAIPEAYMETEMIQGFLHVLKSDELRAVLKELGGYGI